MTNSDDHLPTSQISALAIHDECGQQFSAAIHDGVAQSLTGLALLARSLASDLELRLDSPNESAMASEIVEQLCGCVEQVRALARLADPARVTAPTLGQALRDIALALPPQRRKMLAIDVDVAPPWLGSHEAVALMRLATQATHLMRAAGGPEALELALRADERSVRLTLRGRAVQRAIAANVLDTPSGRLLTARASALGGTTSVESRTRPTARWTFELRSAGAP